MALHNELGRQGEMEALCYLSRAGYTLHDRNWRVGHLELDIVAEWFGEIVFVEVKTRRDEHFAPAAEAVTPQKKRNLIEAAHEWLMGHGRQGAPYRYDIITVIGAAPPFRLTHLKNAYTEWQVREQRRHHDEFRV